MAPFKRNTDLYNMNIVNFKFNWISISVDENSDKKIKFESVSAKDLLKQHKELMKQKMKSHKTSPVVNPLSTTPTLGRGFYPGGNISLDSPKLTKAKSVDYYVAKVSDFINGFCEFNYLDQVVQNIITIVLSVMNQTQNIKLEKNPNHCQINNFKTKWFSLLKFYPTMFLKKMSPKNLIMYKKQSLTDESNKLIKLTTTGTWFGQIYINMIMPIG